MPTLTTPQVHFRPVDGVRIRYADSSGLRLPAVVLTSPWPESVYTFAPMWASLSGYARLFAVDRHDRVDPLANAEFLDQPTACQPSGDHRCRAPRWEEAPAKYASVILDSITSNWS